MSWSLHLTDKPEVHMRFSFKLLLTVVAVCLALIWRSPPTDVTQHLKVEIKPLTEAETEYLELFTDFCKYTDKPGDYIKDNRSTETKQSVNFLNPAPFPTSQTFPS